MKIENKTECIFEKVYIETPVDTDGDGLADLVAAYIKRPVSTLSGDRVPAVLVANPYLMTCNEDWYVPHDVNGEVKVYPEQNIKEEDIRFDFSAPLRNRAKKFRTPEGEAETNLISEDVEFECISELYGYLNQKGYASVFCGGLGTRGSDGYTLSGSREEIAAFKSVIDWLNGRCRAYTDKRGTMEIKAKWCTGNVAMSAKSYLGTMCIGVAATGVEGLKAIIPEAGICNWYDYYRGGGLNVPALEWQGDDLDILAKYCFSRAKDPEDYAVVKDGYDEALKALEAGEDRASANYNKFWDERNYLNQADNIKAAVFIIHGLNDWNVKTNQCLPLFKALEERGVDRKILLHQGEHVYVYDLEGAGVLSMVERWLNRYLKGEDNGIDKEPKVLVESNVDQSMWMASETWPPADWRYVTFPVASEGRKTIVDDLSATVYDKEKDNQKEWLDELVLGKDGGHNGRLMWTWNPFETESRLRHGEAVRVAGTAKVAFDAAIDKRTAILSAMLVDLGEERRITAEQVAVDGRDDGTFRFGLEEEPSLYKVISRGWLNAQNRTCLWSKEEIRPGETYTYEIDMVPTDYTLAQGHKLALILYGIDAQQTQRPDTVTRITVDTASVKAMIPLSSEVK